uniref:Uncharacterized protein n=1 Tax=Macaca nemestrina TaxID=9545 RepID=A0A2K6C881_MACNE
MCAEHQTGRTGWQEDPADRGGQASRGSEGSLGPLASGQASKALKETRGNPGPLETPARWATQGPVAPSGTVASQELKVSRATQETSRTSRVRPSRPFGGTHRWGATWSSSTRSSPTRKSRTRTTQADSSVLYPATTTSPSRWCPSGRSACSLSPPQGARSDAPWASVTPPTRGSSRWCQGAWCFSCSGVTRSGSKKTPERVTFTKVLRLTASSAASSSSRPPEPGKDPSPTHLSGFHAPLCKMGALLFQLLKGGGWLREPQDWLPP